MSADDDVQITVVVPGFVFDVIMERLEVRRARGNPKADGSPLEAPYFTVAEAALRARCNEKTVRVAIRRSELVASKVAGRWLISATDLRAWLEGRAPFRK